jgi:hypothetical protein
MQPASILKSASFSFLRDKPERRTAYVFAIGRRLGLKRGHHRMEQGRTRERYSSIRPVLLAIKAMNAEIAGLLGESGSNQSRPATH